MTEQHFNECIQNKIPIYMIWVKDSKFHKKKVAYEDVNKGRLVNWINTTIPYNTVMQCEIMYASEDKLEQCINKLFNYLEKEEKRKITEAKKKLKYLCKVREAIK